MSGTVTAIMNYVARNGVRPVYHANDSSKDQGGDLGCQPPGTYVQEFEDAVQSLPIGKVSAPVHTQFGWHLVLVRERRQATTEELAAADQQAQQAYFLDIVCKHAAVHVNPSYGRWDTSPCKGGQGLAQVSPPAGPAPGK